MSCDSTHQSLARRQAADGAARLAEDPHDCVCDCAVVEAVNRADEARAVASHGAAADRPAPQK